MTENSEKLVERLKIQISSLISKYEATTAENRKLNQRLYQEEKRSAFYKNRFEREQSKNKELEDRINVLKISEAFIVSKGEAEEARKAIREIIEEIDGCIAEINKE